MTFDQPVNWVLKSINKKSILEVGCGGGTGTIKFEKAIALLQSWVKGLGWKFDLTNSIYVVTANVGKLHAEQRKEPEEPPEEVPAETSE